MATIFSRSTGRWASLLAGLFGLGVLGCQHTPIDLTQGPAPWRMPRPGKDAKTFEDSLTGGEVFAMYCNQCHNARALGERPFVELPERGRAHACPCQLHGGRVREADGVLASMARYPVTHPAGRARRPSVSSSGSRSPSCARRSRPRPSPPRAPSRSPGLNRRRPSRGLPPRSRQAAARAAAPARRAGGRAVTPEGAAVDRRVSGVACGLRDQS